MLTARGKNPVKFESVLIFAIMNYQYIGNSNPILTLNVWPDENPKVDTRTQE